MNRNILLAAALVATLGGCATYDYVGNSAPGCYYHGRPSTQYYDYGPYGSGYLYPGTSIYLGIGSGGYYPGYRYYPYYGHYNPYYPHYRPHPRPPRPDNNGGGHDRDKRPPPWRDPTGQWRESGRVMIPPRTPATPVPPARSEPRRVMSQPSAPRMRSEPPRVSSPQPARVERAVPSVDRAPRPERGIQVQEP